ncbi:hypothetical protein B0J11DRAFT_539972 [Dendryphion nanum]|uniref:RED-like N-terminal domain-containing protein n=1 Tax=Dendryphion nanum TaxID=256645 RepID=A0A9P9DA07_9PLEO|nr:hypothetical protein B0J11DRAFT_539972 [Dendryphion nanum]
MNNDQFRRLLINNSQKQDGSARNTPSSKALSTQTLGSRKQSSVPMTPRHVGRNSATSDFARQLAERNAKGSTTKKWKSSAPKGVKLAAGYTDRTKNRPEDDENDDRVKRIKALEEAMKEGQLDRATFESLVQEITGGDIESTHLVRGLDRRLLDRLRRGEDVQIGTSQDDQEESNDDDDGNGDLDALEQQEIVPIVREKTDKKGERAPPAPVAGVKRTRDALLAELKAQRKAAAEAAAAEHEKKYPTLGPGFRKVGPKGESTRIETDSRGREILIITDAEGNEKRKVRKQKVEDTTLETRYDLDNPTRPVNVPNLPVPAAKEESEDEDIFAGVGSNFNPLGDLDQGGDSSSDGEETDTEAKPGSVNAKVDDGEDGEDVEKEDKEAEDEGVSDGEIDGEVQQRPAPSSTTLSRRNYFSETPSTNATNPNVADATVLAALKKVRTLDPDSALLQTDEETRLRKRAAMLGARDRDMEDLDMGFGSSRFDDADDMDRDGEKVRLTEWKGLGTENDDDVDDAKHDGGAKKRKRGAKSKKGDKNSAADVLRVMERQKGTNT